MEAVLDSAILDQLGEHFAAGYFEQPDASPMRRWSRAVRRRFERRALTPYAGERLYPSGPAACGGENRIVAPSYSFTYAYNERALLDLLPQAHDDQRETLIALQSAMRDLGARLTPLLRQHGVGGAGYTHGIPNYGRVIREGLDGYEQRVAERLARAQRQGDAARADFCLGLRDVLIGIRSWHVRVLEMLRQSRVSDALGETRRQRLVGALEQVPFRPARDFFEALVAYNLVFYLDDCDNPGRVDLELSSFYERDLAAGRISHEEAVGLIRNLWENADANNSWSAGIGGTDSAGDPAYNDLTIVCLEAARKIRRPNLQLHVRGDMPQAVWEAALDTIATGCGLPALYNEEQYLRALREAHLGIREADLGWHNGGGCTETMIHGCSNVGSLDAGINLPLILVETLNEHLPKAWSLAELMAAYKTDVAATVREIVAQVNANQQAKARLRPQPMRSLLIDDCIESGLEFNDGGARYNWSVINVAGLANVIDSLAAVQEVVFDRKELSGAELLAALQSDFTDAEPLRRRLQRCPRFGNDDPRADALATEIADFVFREFLLYAPWRGGKFLPSCLMFTTYAGAGKPVNATPDGRRAGEPIADSAGAHQGRDIHGPTALLKSVAAIPHHLAAGTLVVNARFNRDLFATPSGRERLRDLVRAYFDLGGMQLQINVLDQAVLREAIAHPERHADLIVRIGGYSEYFSRLSPELKQTVLERTEHGAG
jgi:formate C-acetyltransferase